MIKFLHAADIHLDSPRSGLDRDPDAPADDIQRAPRRALENLVDLALREKVDFVLIAGDLYDGDWKDYRTGLFFLDQMRKLQAADVPVFLIAGNHDAANRMTKSLALPPNVMLFDSKRAQTKTIERLGVAIHGQSFAKQAVLENLSEAYPEKRGGLFNIGLLHTCATNADHDPYAPCTPSGLQLKGYDYWALGHVHERQPLHAAGAAPIHFPGNLQGRHIRETGAKGCLMVTVNGEGTATTEFVPLDVFRWELLQIKADGADRADEVIERFSNELRRKIVAADGRPLAVRVDVAGACRAHEQLASEPKRWYAEFQSAAAQTGDGQVWVEKIVRSTTLPVEFDAAALHDGPVGELIEFIRELQASDTLLAEILNEADDLKSLRSKLPGTLTEGKDALDFVRPERLPAVLDDVRQILTSRLAPNSEIP